MFTKEKEKDYYLLTTQVENLFIKEMMPEIPGEYLKVYLLGLMAADNNLAISIDEVGRSLKMPKSEVDKAFLYFEKHSLIKTTEKEDGSYDVTFVSTRDLLYGKVKDEMENTGKAKEAQENVDLDLKEVIAFIENETGRLLSEKELKEVLYWIDDVKATRDTIEAAVSYCLEKGKFNLSYMGKVVYQWTMDGLDSKEKIDEYIKSLGERQGAYRRVMNSLGFSRQVTEAERELIDIWLDEWKFNIDRIVEACGKTISQANPSLRYVNKVLENWKNEAQEFGVEVNNNLNITKQDLNRYFEFLREEAIKKANERKEEVYRKVPKIKEIDDNLRALRSKLSMGVLSGLSKEQISELKDEIEKCEISRQTLLKENTYSLDYTEIKYRCEKCKDTGIDENGQKCTCLNERMGEAKLWQRSQKEK